MCCSSRQLENESEEYSSPVAEKHVAVLPLEIVGDGQETQALGDGLMDSLAGKLSNLYASNKTLWVVPPSEVRARKVTEPASAMREFGATIVVKGSFERNGRAARLRLTLIDPKKTARNRLCRGREPFGRPGGASGRRRDTSRTTNEHFDRNRPIAWSRRPGDSRRIRRLSRRTWLLSKERQS